MAVPLPHLFIYLSPLELPDLFISSINYLTFSSISLSLSHLLNSLTSSSPQLITLPFHLPLSHSHLLNSLTSSSPQLIAPPISYLNLMLGFFFFSLHVVPIVLLLFESQRCVLSPLVSDWLCRFHAFIYLFIWFFYSAQYFYFLAFGVLCSVGFIIL
jgi:hypothetical protein